MKFRMLLIWVPHALLVGRVVNVPLQYIGRDLLFAGNAIVQGLVVSVTLASAFLGCAISGTIADSFGRRRAFQISCVPMIIGAIIR
jgi:MFS family permease